MSIARHITVVSWVTTALSLAACAESTVERGERDPNKLSNEGALACTERPEGRSYPLFNGDKLEETRVNESASANRARFKPYSALAGELGRTLGAVPPSLAAAAASFDDPPPRWYAEAAQSGTSLNAVYELSFEACQQSIQGKPAYASAMPTPESADRFCRSLMRRAWSRAPSPEELSGCVELATKKLDAESQPLRRWAYTCASVLSSSHFLTF